VQVSAMQSQVQALAMQSQVQVSAMQSQVQVSAMQSQVQVSAMQSQVQVSVHQSQEQVFQSDHMQSSASWTFGPHSTSLLPFLDTRLSFGNHAELTWCTDCQWLVLCHD
jgi:hypothetical protein